MKINVKLEKKIQHLEIIPIISFLLFFKIVNIEFINSPVYTLAEYIFLFVAALYSFRHANKINKEEYRVISIVAILGMCIFISACINHVESYYIRAAAYYAVYLTILFFYLAVIASDGKVNEFLKAGKIYLTIVLCINDVLMILLPDVFYNIHERDIGTCLLGNKFSVAYAHMLYIFIVCFLEQNEAKRKKKLFICSVIMSVLCIFIDCTTALLAIWVFVFLYFLGPKIRNILSSPISVILVFGLSSVLLILFSDILNFAPLRFFIENILHRDATLTGRMEVYPYIFQLVSNHKWFGYGYGTTIVKETTIWYANVQNAFWDFIIRYGIITMIIMVVLLVFVVHRQHKIVKKKDMFQYYLWFGVCMIYVYIFMGIGEIVYGIYFFFYIAIINAVCIESEITFAGGITHD